MTGPSPTTWAELCRLAKVSVDRLDHDLGVLLEEAARYRRGIYPTSVRPSSGGGSGASDPVGDAVAETVDRYAKVSVYEREATAALQRVIEISSSVRGLLQPPAPSSAVHVPLCVNCGEAALPRPKAGRCEACYRYRLRHEGEDRRPELVTSTGGTA